MREKENPRKRLSSSEKLLGKKVIKLFDVRTPQRRIRKDRSGDVEKKETDLSSNILWKGRNQKDASGGANKGVEAVGSTNGPQRESAGNDGNSGGGPKRVFSEADGKDWREKTPDRYYSEVPFREPGDLKYVSYEQLYPEDLALMSKVLNHLLTADISRVRPQTIAIINTYWRHFSKEKGKETDASNLVEGRDTHEQQRIEELFDQSDNPSRVTAYDYVKTIRLLGRGAFPQAHEISRDQKLIIWEGLLKQLDVLDNDLEKEHIEIDLTPHEVRQIMTEFPPGEIYKKQEADWRRLNEIEQKMREDGDLDAADLAFLYEVHSPILGFNNRRDKRISEIQAQRDAQQDMPIALDCESSQIARTAKEINDNSRAYVGALTPGIFTLLQEHGITQIYTDFPEGEIHLESIDIHNTNAGTLLYELKQGGLHVDNNARSLIESMQIQSNGPEVIQTVRLRVRDLGIKEESPLLSTVYERAKELGLALCPPEVGPQYQLQHTDQTEDKYVYLAMESMGDFDVFCMNNNMFPNLGVNTWRNPIRGIWSDKTEFLFSLPGREKRN